MGQRADNSQAFPLCATCHHDFHASKGYFRWMKKSDKRAFQDAMVAAYTPDENTF